MTKPTFWWNCKHLTKKPLESPYCTKYNNFCLKSKCEEITDTKNELKKELEE